MKMSKILIVDDEDQMRELLARMLELEGYEIYQAADCKNSFIRNEKELSRTSCCVMFFFLMGMA